MSTEALRECPFCGGEAWLDCTMDGTPDLFCRVRCRDCGAHGPMFANVNNIATEAHDARKKAPDAWNRRPSLAGPAAAVDLGPGLERAIDIIGRWGDNIRSPLPPGTLVDAAERLRTELKAVRAAGPTPTDARGDEVEVVARAICAYRVAHCCSLRWDDAPEWLIAEFTGSARAAIAALDAHRSGAKP